jgi:hypothetical protein
MALFVKTQSIRECFFVPPPNSKRIAKSYDFAFILRFACCECPIFRSQTAFASQKPQNATLRSCGFWLASADFYLTASQRSRFALACFATQIEISLKVFLKKYSQFALQKIF